MNDKNTPMLIRGVKPGQERKDPFHENVVWDIVPERTALLVIDMQNAFIMEKGFYYLPAAKGVVPKINEIAKTCREYGILVVWVVRTPCRRDGLDIGYEKIFFPGQIDNPAALCEGGWGKELYSGMDYKDGELIVTKTRYGAFTPGSSNLDRILRYMDKDTVIIAGVCTNICCGTTAREAMMLDYKVIFVSDANEAFGEITPGGYGAGMIQEAELLTLRSCFAMVCTTDELLAEIRKK